MRQFVLIINMFLKFLFLTHNEIKLKLQVGDAEHLTKAKFIRNTAKEIMQNETCKK